MKSQLEEESTSTGLKNSKNNSTVFTPVLMSHNEYGCKIEKCKYISSHACFKNDFPNRYKVERQLLF